MTGTAGTFPEWKTARLDAIADLLSGGTPSKGRADWWRGSVPWASPKDMKQLRLSDTVDHVTEEAARSGSRIVPAKTIFVVIRGMILAKALPVAMAEVPMAFNQDMKAIIARSVVDPDYLLYALASRRGALTRDIGTSAHGTRRLSSSALAALEIPIPSSTEQRAIAYMLSRMYARIQVQARALATLKSLKTATEGKLFGRGLRGEPMKKTDVGEIPEKWKIVPLAAVLISAQYGLSIRGERSGRLPMLRMNCQQDGRVVFRDLQYVDLDAAALEAFRLHDGDLLFNRTNSYELVGRTAIFRGDHAAVFASYLIRLSVDQNVIAPEFLNYYLNLESTQKALKVFAARGVSQSNISASRLRQLDIPLPSHSEQAAIVSTLDRLVDAHLLATKSLTVLRSLFDVMLDALMTGKVRLSPRLIGRLSLRARESEAKPHGKVDENVVEEAVRRIIDAVAPQQIILFGSAARGEMHKDSDLDFLVVKTGMTSRDATHAIRDRLRGIGVPIDIVVVSPEIVERYRDIVGHIVRPALREGRVVYAA